MKKSVENLKTSKITGGLRHPLKTRQKFETDRYPNEAEMGKEQETVTRKTRGNNRKTGLKIASFVNLVMGDSKVKKSKIVKVLENQKFKDRVSLVDNVDDAFALGYLAVGVTDWNKASDADFNKAAAFLREVHKNVRTYHADGAEGAELMKSGEILLEWTWNEVAATLGWDGLPVAMNRETKEGASTWVCGYTMMKDAPGSEQKAYDFIDAWLADSSAEYILTEWGYGHSNSKVMAAIGEENGFGSLESYTKNTLWQAPTAPALREKMIKEWELIKSGF